MEIHTLYSLDIFLQGVFLLICLSIGLYLVFNDNLEKLNSAESIKEISSNLHNIVERLFSTASFKGFVKGPKETLKLLGAIPIFVIGSFILGILGHGIADDWIDSKSQNHLFLKPLWISDLSLNNDDFNRVDLTEIQIDTFSHYKKRIRFKSYLQVFNPDKTTNPRVIEQLYYHAKHELLKNEQYYNYVRKSQTLAEYSRIFVLGFFILFLCGLINMFIMIIRTVFISKEELFRKYKELLTTKGMPMDDGRFDIPDLVILIFNLLSVLAIVLLVGPNFGNMSAYGFGMYLLLLLLCLFGCGTFLLNFSRKFRVYRFSFFIYSIFYVVSFLGYYGSAKMWVSSERTVVKKVFGLYKSIHISSEIEEIKFAKGTLKLDVFPKD